MEGWKPPRVWRGVGGLDSARAPEMHRGGRDVSSAPRAPRTSLRVRSSGLPAATEGLRPDTLFLKISTGNSRTLWGQAFLGPHKHILPRMCAGSGHREDVGAGLPTLGRQLSLGTPDTSQRGKMGKGTKRLPGPSPCCCPGSCGPLGLAGQ